MSQPVGTCPGCGGDEPFERIHVGTCPDTDDECPEWACVSCGAAVIMGTVPGSAVPAASTGTVDGGGQAGGQAVRAA